MVRIWVSVSLMISACPRFGLCAIRSDFCVSAIRSAIRSVAPNINEKSAIAVWSSLDHGLLARVPLYPRRK